MHHVRYILLVQLSHMCSGASSFASALQKRIAVQKRVHLAYMREQEREKLQQVFVECRFLFIVTGKKERRREFQR